MKRIAAEIKIIADLRYSVKFEGIEDIIKAAGQHAAFSHLSDIRYHAFFISHIVCCYPREIRNKLTGRLDKTIPNSFKIALLSTAADENKKTWVTKGLNDGPQGLSKKVLCIATDIANDLEARFDQGAYRIMREHLLQLLIMSYSCVKVIPKNKMMTLTEQFEKLHFKNNLQ